MMLYPVTYSMRGSGSLRVIEDPPPDTTTTTTVPEPVPVPFDQVPSEWHASILLVAVLTMAAVWAALGRYWTSGTLGRR
jgi:hypothetical protein